MMPYVSVNPFAAGYYLQKSSLIDQQKNRICFCIWKLVPPFFFIILAFIIQFLSFFKGGCNFFYKTKKFSICFKIDTICFFFLKMFSIFWNCLRFVLLIFIVSFCLSNFQIYVPGSSSKDIQFVFDLSPELKSFTALRVQKEHHDRDN